MSEPMDEATMAVALAKRFIEEGHFQLAQENIEKARRIAPNIKDDRERSLDDLSSECIAIQVGTELGKECDRAEVKNGKKDMSRLLIQKKSWLSKLDSAAAISPGLSTPLQVAVEVCRATNDAKTAYGYAKRLSEMFPENVEFRAEFEKVKKVATGFQGSWKLLIGLGAFALIGFFSGLGQSISMALTSLFIFGGGCIAYWFLKQGVKKADL